MQLDVFDEERREDEDELPETININNPLDVFNTVFKKVSTIAVNHVVINKILVKFIFSENVLHMFFNTGSTRYL